MKLEELTPLAAAFIRGFMTKAHEEEQGLRDCGEAGKSQVEDLEMEISPQYITKLTRNLVNDGYIIKARRGRHYIVAKGEHWGEFFNWLDDESPEGWGETNKLDQEWPDRLKVVNLERLGKGMRSSTDETLPSAAFRLAMVLFKSGDFDMAFFPKGSEVMLCHRDDDGTMVKDGWVKTWSKINHEKMQQLIDEMDADDE